MGEAGVQIFSAVFIFEAGGLLEEGAVADVGAGVGVLDFFVRAMGGGLGGLG